MQGVSQACGLLAGARHIRIFAHATADAVCASAILASAFNQAQKHYAFSFFSRYSDPALSDLTAYDTIVFLDLIPSAKFQSQKNVLILTHRALHEPKLNSALACTLTPPRLGIKHGEISTAGIAHLLCSQFNSTTHLHLPLIGACAESMNTEQGFTGYNHQLLKEAVDAKILTITEELRLPGKEKPLAKVLEWCIDPYFQGLFGSEQNCEAFLHQLGIHTKHEEDWRRLSDLTPEEYERLCHALQTLVPEYPLKGSCITFKGHDVIDITETLSACALLNRAHLGIGFCLGDTSSFDRALLLRSEYHRAVLDALTFARKQQVSQKTYTFVSAKQQIPLSLLSCVSHLLSHEKKTTTLCMGNDGTSTLLAVSGPDIAIIHSLCLTLKDLTLISESEAIAPLAKEAELAMHIEQLLRKVSIEEMVH